MITELRQREYDGTWVLYGLVDVPRESPSDWTDPSLPLLQRWLPIKTYDWVADIEA